MRKVFSAELFNSISEIRRLGELCDSFAEEYQLSARAANAITVALDEIITNTISYGYDDQLIHSIHLEFYLAEKECMVIVTDDARQFNPLSHPDTDLSLPLDEKKIGGLGLHLVKNLIDTVNYKYEGGKNIITLIKKLD
ncbi:MAG: ATP-binding protein [Bacteroidota bacterium]